MKKTPAGAPSTPAASPRGRGSATKPPTPQHPGPSGGLFGSDFSTPGGSTGGAGDDAMSIASSHGSQGWEDEQMEESVKAAEKREVAYHVQRLEELGYTAGPRAKATLVPKKRKGRTRNISIWSTHVAYPWAPAELGLPLREHVVGPFPRTCRQDLYPRHVMWGATTNLRLATELPIYGHTYINLMRVPAHPRRGRAGEGEDAPLHQGVQGVTGATCDLWLAGGGTASGDVADFGSSSDKGAFTTPLANPARTSIPGAYAILRVIR